MISEPADGFALAAQAAARLRDMGLAAPWELTAPLPAALAAWLAQLTGCEVRTALMAVVLLGWLAGAAAIFALVRGRLDARAAAQAGLIALLLPSHLLALWRTGEPDLILFWSLAPVLALAVVRRSWVGAAVALLLMIGCRSAHWSWLELLAALELATLAALFESSNSRAWPRLGAALTFGVIGLMLLLAEPPPNAVGRTLEAIELEARLHPQRRAGLALIRSPGHAGETLLWLRALAVSSVTAPCEGKLAGVLEKRGTPGGNCVFGITQGAAEAVIVSRSQADQLQPVRGPLDVERLERYVTWAARPESLTVHRDEPGRLRIEADLGPNSAILLRRDFQPSWRVTPSSVRVREDPLGYTLLDVDGGGEIELTLETDAGLLSALWPPALDSGQVDTGEFPIIHAEGVVDGSTFSGPPFVPGAVVSVFGRRFDAEGNEVYVGDRQAEILFESKAQINIKLPTDLPNGEQALRVISRDRPTEPYPIEVTP